MPKYRWSCQSCGDANNAEDNRCASCGCPAAANGETLENWKVAERKSPELPTRGPVWDRSIFSTHETENCPSCRMHMYLPDRECPHCGFVQDPDQRHSFFESYEEKKNRALRQGAIFTTVFFIIATILFWWLDLPGSLLPCGASLDQSPCISCSGAVPIKKPPHVISHSPTVRAES